MDGGGLDRQFRCSACGNLTRFDVTVSRRVKEFRHFSVGGDLTIESSEILDEVVDRVECRWCRASGDTIELRSGSEPVSPADSDAGAA
ncbi:MAG: hypothetical protein ACXVJW_11965 [Acidimicrobiia bacterium]